MSDVALSDRLRHLWRQGQPPDLDEFLAAAGPLGARELVDVLRADQSARWRAGAPIPAEDYLRRYPIAAADPEAALDLIHNEYLLAERADRVPEVEAFVGRFPAHADTLRLQIDLHRAMLPPTHSAVPNGAPPAAGATTLARDDSVETIPAGQVFGDYELLETIARGGMGVVYKARQPKLDRVVALKMILAGQFASDEAVERFRTEARAAAQLDHPGIVPVFEIGECQGQHYFAMAYVEGRSLADLLRDGPLPAVRAARIVRDLCAAVAYAHDHGVVHRDLKPANVILDSQGNAKLTDFGLAKRTASDSGLTGTGEILGTPAYMAPEQAQGSSSAVGPATDVYGLGALLFALLTGRAPFQAATPMETLGHVVSADPPRARALNPGVPRDLETICRKCLDKAPGRRYSSATAMSDDIDRFLSGRPILARPVGLVERAYRVYRRHPVMGSMAAALTVLIVAVPVLLAALWGEAEARAGAEAAARTKEAAARVKLEAAEVEKTHQLFSAYVKEAAALRSSPKVGRRFLALDRLLAARDLADKLELSAEDYTRLRSEAISALSLNDIRRMSAPPGWGYALLEPQHFMGADDRYAAWDADGLLLRRPADDSAVRLPFIPTDRARADVHVSPDNRFVSILDAATLLVWSVDGAQPTERARRGNVYKGWFSPDRPEVVVLGRDRGVSIVPLDGTVAPKVLTLVGLWPKPIYSSGSALGPRRQLALGGPKSVFVVDLEGGKVAYTVTLPAQAEQAVWSPDGETLAVSCVDSQVVLYHPRDNTQHVFKGPLGGPVGLAFDPSGRFLLMRVPWAGHYIVLDVGRRVPELRFHAAELSRTREEPLAAPKPEWWLMTRDDMHRVLPLRAEDGQATETSLAVHPNGRLLVTPTSKGIVLTDLISGERVGFVAAPGTCRCARFDKDGNLYAVRQRRDRSFAVGRWSVKPDGKALAIGAPEALGKAVAENIDVSLDGRFIAHALGHGSMVFDRKNGLQSPVVQQEDVRQVAVHPDGSLVAAFSFGSPGFQVWHAKDGKLSFASPTGLMGAGRFTPDGRRLVTHGYGETDLLAWSVPDGKLAQRLGPVGSFAISPDSRMIAVTEPNGAVRLNYIADGLQIARFEVPSQDYLLDLAFSPDGRFLVGLNTERTQHHVWDLWKLREQLRDLRLDWTDDPPPRTGGNTEPLSVRVTAQTWWGPFVGPLNQTRPK